MKIDNDFTLKNGISIQFERVTYIPDVGVVPPVRQSMWDIARVSLSINNSFCAFLIDRPGLMHYKQPMRHAIESLKKHAAMTN